MLRPHYQRMAGKAQRWCVLTDVQCKTLSYGDVGEVTEGSVDE
jgi:hypothetical protein